MAEANPRRRPARIDRTGPPSRRWPLPHPRRCSRPPPTTPRCWRPRTPARGTVPDSTIYSIESEHDGTQWEVEVLAADGVKHEVEVSADGAAVLTGPIAKPDDTKDVTKHRDRVQAAKLNFRAAVDAITKAVDGRVTELGLDDRDDGPVVGEADVIDSANTVHEVSVDAATGAVVAQKRPSARAQGDHGRAVGQGHRRHPRREVVTVGVELRQPHARIGYPAA